MLELNETLSTPEIRYLVSIVNERVHPDFIFFLLHQCRKQARAGVSWSQLGTSELDLKLLEVLCNQHQVIREIQKILAQNAQRPLNLVDADRLEMLMETADYYYLDWRRVPFTRATLWTIIDLTRTGYRHRQSA